MTAASSSLLPCCCSRLLLFLVIFFTAATSPSSGWLQIIPPINYYSNIHSPRPSSFHSSLRLPRRSSQLQSSRDDNEEKSTANIQTTGGGGGSDQLQLRIGKRVGSGAYGTVHIATHLLDDDSNDNETKYIAKRAWTLSELELNVPMAVMQLDNNNGAENNRQRTGVVCSTGLAEQDNNNKDIDSSDHDDTNNGNNTDKLKETAARCQHYWNVERHIVQKLAEGGGDAINDSYVTPQFKGVYQSAPIDNNDNDEGEQGEIVPGYGTINKLDSDSDDNNNNQGMGAFFSMFNDGDDDNKEGLCHEWMVFEYIPSPLSMSGEESLPALTLLDAMEVSHSAFPYLYFTHSPR